MEKKQGVIIALLAVCVFFSVIIADVSDLRQNCSGNYCR